MGCAGASDEVADPSVMRPAVEVAAARTTRCPTARIPASPGSGPSNKEAQHFAHADGVVGNRQFSGAGVAVLMESRHLMR